MAGTVGLGNIRMAQTLLGGIAARAGADGDPRAQLQAWMNEQGIDLDGLIEAAEAVAADEIEEIEMMIDSGEPYGTNEMRATVIAVFEQAFLVGWICADRVARREAAAARREAE